MTEALYLADSTISRFDATVERVLDDRVVLDRTHFYPTGGGQPADHGTLEFDGESVAVTDTQKKDTIYHYVESADALSEGDTVTGALDWDRRFAHMRYHTAQHLLSAVLLDEYDAPTVGNQLYDDRARLDCEYPRFDETDLADIEALCNEYVERACTVEHVTMARERAEAELDTQRTRIDLLPDSITELRIVTIRDADEVIDRTACAGTHVTNTSDLGEFRMTGRQTQGSEKERVSFVLA